MNNTIKQERKQKNLKRLQHTAFFANKAREIVITKKIQEDMQIMQSW